MTSTVRRVVAVAALVGAALVPATLASTAGVVPPEETTTTLDGPVGSLPAVAPPSTTVGAIPTELLEDPAGEPALDDDGSTVLGSEQAALEAEARSADDRYIVALADDAALTAVQTELVARGVPITNTWSGTVVGMTALLDEPTVVELRSRPGVVTVELDGVAELSGRQDGAPWNLDRLDQRSLPLDSVYSSTATGLGVTAYVLDSGIRASHVEFQGRVVPGAFWDYGEGTGSTDCHGHGTHVAGTIGGTTWGVAKAVTIVPVKVSTCAGGISVSVLLEAIDWVIADHRAGVSAVLNMSLGTPPSAVLDSAIERLIADGVTVVAASGNDAGPACSSSPGRVPAVITVAASTIDDDDAWFSNYGPCNDLFAPGVGIRSASFTSDTGSMTMNGTSMAAPHVAGAAALVLQRRPGATPAQVWQTLSAEATRGAISECCGDPDVLLHVPPPVTAPPGPLPVGDGPGAASAAAGQIDVFARGQDDRLYVRHFDGTWGGWGSLGGVVTGAPSAASRSPGQLDVFVRGQDGALWTRSLSGGTWSSWTSLGGILTTAPAVVSRSAGTLDVFVVGFDRALYTRRFDGSSWGGWVDLGGVVTAPPAAATATPGTMAVFVKGQDDALWSMSFNGGWSGWSSLGGVITTGPGATSQGVGTYDVFARGTANDLWTRAYDGTWRAWTSLAGVITSPPAAASAAPGTLTVFARGQDAALWADESAGGAYGGWYSLGGIIR